MRRYGWLISISACLVAASPVLGARFGEFAMRSTLSPDTAASTSGQTMIMLAGLNNMDLFGAAPGVRVPVGTVCLMSEPFDPASESVTVHYTISITLIDQLSGQSATLDLAPPAGLTADVTIPTRGNAISHTVTDLPAPVSIRIGSTQYMVSALPDDYFTEPGPPTDKGAGDVGGFSVWIAATPVPEPATCLILLGAVAAMRRR